MAWRGYAIDLTLTVDGSSFDLPSPFTLVPEQSYSLEELETLVAIPGISNHQPDPSQTLRPIMVRDEEAGWAACILVPDVADSRVSQYPHNSPLFQPQNLLYLSQMGVGFAHNLDRSLSIDSKTPIFIDIPPSKVTPNDLAKSSSGVDEFLLDQILDALSRCVATYYQGTLKSADSDLVRNVISISRHGLFVRLAIARYFDDQYLPLRTYENDQWTWQMVSEVASKSIIRLCSATERALVLEKSNRELPTITMSQNSKSYAIIAGGGFDSGLQAKPVSEKQEPQNRALVDVYEWLGARSLQVAILALRFSTDWRNCQTVGAFDRYPLIGFKCSSNVSGTETLQWPDFSTKMGERLDHINDAYEKIIRNMAVGEFEYWNEEDALLWVLASNILHVEGLISLDDVDTGIGYIEGVGVIANSDVGRKIAMVLATQVIRNYAEQTQAMRDRPRSPKLFGDVSSSPNSYVYMRLDTIGFSESNELLHEMRDASNLQIPDFENDYLRLMPFVDPAGTRRNIGGSADL